MGKINPKDYLKRADEFYTKERVLRYSSYSRGLKMLSKSPRYKYIKKILNNIQQKIGKRINVLDLGCGEGRYFHLLKKAKQITGVDASKEMLAAAKKYHGRDKRIRLIRGNILNFYSKERFDLVMSNGVLCEHSPLTLGLLNNVYRMLNNGGYFFFTTTIPSRLTLKLRRNIADIALLMVKPFAKNRWTYRKLLSSYKKPKEVKKLIEKTNFKILKSKNVKHKESHVDQTFWLLKK